MCVCVGGGGGCGEGGGSGCRSFLGVFCVYICVCARVHSDNVVPAPCLQHLSVLTAACGRPCENGGHCVPEGFCWCQKGFYGDVCEFSMYSLRSCYVFVDRGSHK